MWTELAKLSVPLLYLSLFTAFALAIFKGGRAERQGAILYLVMWLAAVVTPVKPGSQLFVYVFLMADAVIAFGFLWLALRFSNLWLAGAMIAQGICFGAHAFRLEDDVVTPRWHGMNIYLLVMNLMSALVLTFILGGTLATWRRRVLERKYGKTVKAPVSVLVRASTANPQPSFRSPA